MVCPGCQSHDLKEYIHEGVTVDFCHSCKGMWFDKAELSFYVSTGTDIPDLKASLEKAYDTQIPCTRCSEGLLKEIKYHPSEDLLIDFCVSCHGVFLDSKEILHLRQAVARHGLSSLGTLLSHLKKDGYIPI